MTENTTTASGAADRYTKKPVTIDAIRWTGKNLREVVAFTDGPPDTRTSHAGMAWDTYVDLVERDGLKIFTLEGKMSAAIGDWIIKGVQGEYYPCKPDIFEATYSPALAASAPVAPTPPDWRELCRRLYVELFHCDKQMTCSLNEDGEPIWRTGTEVRDVLSDAKAALEANPITPEAAPVAPAPQPVPQEWLSDQCGGDFDDMTAGQGYRKGWNDCRARMLAAAPKADQIEDGLAMVPAAPQQGEYLPMTSAAKDGSLIRMLVKFEDHPLDDDDQPQWTVGFNNLSNTQVDEWQFVGWSWQSDLFCDGTGTPIGWLPMLDAARGAAQAAPAVPDMRSVALAAGAYTTAYSMLTHAKVHNADVDGSTKRLVAAINGLRSALGPSAPVAEDARPHRTDAEIVEQTEELARYLLGWGFNHESVPGAPATRNSEHPFALRAWDAACHIQDLLTQTDVWNAVAELDDAQAAQPEGGANANR